MDKLNHDIEPPICPYCGASAVLRDSSEVYHKSFGKVWVCSNYPKCNAYVGCHANTNIPLGSLANRKLRYLRLECHRKFDKLWKNGKMHRITAYELLSRIFKIEKPHIGDFTEEQCQKLLKVFSK